MSAKRTARVCLMNLGEVIIDISLDDGEIIETMKEKVLKEIEKRGTEYKKSEISLICDGIIMKDNEKVPESSENNPIIVLGTKKSSPEKREVVGSPNLTSMGNQINLSVIFGNRHPPRTSTVTNSDVINYAEELIARLYSEEQ